MRVLHSVHVSRLRSRADRAARSRRLRVCLGGMSGMPAWFCTPALLGRRPFVRQKYPPPERASTLNRDAASGEVWHPPPPDPDKSRRDGTTSARLSEQAEPPVQSWHLQVAFCLRLYKLVQELTVFAHPWDSERLLL